MITDPENIDVVEGEVVILKCLYNTLSIPSFDVHWSRSNTTSGALEKMWTYSRSFPSGAEQDQALKGFTSDLERANLHLPANHGHSIKIKNIREENETVYVCELELNYGEQKGTANTTVNVLSTCCFIMFCADLYT